MTAAAGGITLRSVTAKTAPIRVVSARFLFPWTGVWSVEVELDPTPSNPAPTSGQVTIAIGSPVPAVTLAGTIDPRSSGTFGDIVRLLVVGGGGGWDKSVTRQDYQSDSGVLNSRVYAEAAQLVGETVNVISPASLGTHFSRTMGPAARVLEGASWWVDAAGVTQVGPRPTLTPDASMTLISWADTANEAQLVCDVLVLPGTVLTDERLPGPITIRDVEQIFDERGSTVTAFCGDAVGPQLIGDLRAMVLEFGGVKYLRTYEYRIVMQGSDGRVQLQAVNPTEGVPDLLPVSTWTGVSGAKCKYLPGSHCRVAFLGGDPGRPIVDSYDPTSVPLESTVDASVAVHVGPSAASVDLAGGAAPLAVGPWADGVTAALDVLGSALAGFTAGPLAPLGAVGSALVAALGALPPSSTIRTKAT